MHICLYVGDNQGSSQTACIEDIMTSHHRNHDSSSDEENTAEEEEEINFQCDEGLDNSDVDLMSRIE
jgi:hypothetical protein